MRIFAMFLLLIGPSWSIETKPIEDKVFRTLNALHEESFLKSLDILISSRPLLALKIFQKTRNENIKTQQEVINELSLSSLSVDEINLFFKQIKEEKPRLYQEFKKRLQGFYLIFQKRMDYERRLRPILEDLNHIIDQFKPYQILEPQDKKLYYSLARVLIQNDKDLLKNYLGHIYAQSEFHQSIDWALDLPFFKDFSQISDYEQGALVPKDIGDLANLNSEDFDRYIQQNQLVDMRSLLANHLQSVDLLQGALLKEALTFKADKKLLELKPSVLSSNFAIGFMLLNNGENLVRLGKKLAETDSGKIFYLFYLGITDNISDKIIDFLQSIIQSKEAYWIESANKLIHLNDPQKSILAEYLAEFVLAYEVLKREHMSIEVAKELMPHHTEHIVDKIGYNIRLQEYNMINEKKIEELAKNKVLKCLQFWM